MFILKELLEYVQKNIQNDLNSLKNLFFFSHLDSWDINNVNESNFEKENKIVIPREGLRCDFKSIFELWRSQGGNPDQIWCDIKEAIVKSILSCEKVISHWIRKKVKRRMTCFELLGYDILVDQNFHVWLLEINHTPSLSPHTELENTVKKDMIHHFFNLVDMENSWTKHVRENAKNKYEKLNPIVPKSNLPPWDDNKNIQKERLSKIDILAIIETIIQHENRSKFEIAFPDTDAMKYWNILTMNNKTKLLAIWVGKKYNVNTFLT